MPGILIAEDEALVGLFLRDELTAAGYEVVGPVASVREATAAVIREALSGAVVDVSLQGGDAYAVMDELLARGVPILVSTGGGHAGMPERFRSIPTLHKPYTMAQIGAVLPELFGVPDGGSSAGRPEGPEAAGRPGSHSN